MNGIPCEENLVACISSFTSTSGCVNARERVHISDLHISGDAGHNQPLAFDFFFSKGIESTRICFFVSLWRHFSFALQFQFTPRWCDTNALGTYQGANIPQSPQPWHRYYISADGAMCKRCHARPYLRRRSKEELAVTFLARPNIGQMTNSKAIFQAKSIKLTSRLPRWSNRPPSPPRHGIVCSQATRGVS
jgi:hypothetical protein